MEALNNMNAGIALIMSFISLVGISFIVYLHFKNPQSKMEIAQAVTDKEVTNKATILAQQEMESKANLLATQVEWEKASNEKKFIEYGKKLDEVMLSGQREILKIEVKLDHFISTQNHRNEESGNNFTKLFTLLEERLPKKTN